MNLYLGPELEAYAREKARRDGYQSLGEVVRQALREMRERERADLAEPAPAQPEPRGSRDG